MPTIISTRLRFEKDVIERLNDDASFDIKTPEGIFRMTKRQFYDTFENVVNSNSYKKEGVYHYPTTPKKAYQYLIKVK